MHKDQEIKENYVYQCIPIWHVIKITFHIFYTSGMIFFF